MKKLYTFLAMIFLMTTAFVPTYAQTKVTEDDTKASLEISRNIVKLVSELAKDFGTVKGDLVTKTDDGTSVYSVIGMETMKATNQYIMIKQGGAAYYIASYETTAADAKTLTMSFAAFTGGVTTLTNADGNFVIGHDDKVKSADDKQVYIMSVRGIKVGSYTMEVKKKESTMIIGFL